MRGHLALRVLLAVGALLLVLRHVGQLEHDPLVRVPASDARAAWEHAGRIAAGELVGDEPFFSAPLPVWLLAGVRAAGGGIAAALLLHAALHLATAAVLARVGLRLAGRAGALAAAAAWLLAADPAFLALRLLPPASACLLASLAWERCLALRDAPTPRRAAGAGLVLGLGVLAQPALLLGVPLLAAWAGRVARRAAPGLAFAAAAALPLSASLAHNLAACGEPILVSAQAGLTFAHGNAPGADGTYHAVPGVSTDRLQQNHDARELLRDETGGSWAATSDAFRDRGLSFWAAEPGAALALLARKAWWFLSGWRYGDTYVPALEAEDGLLPLWWTAPLPSALLVFAGLAALALALRGGRAGLPELVLAGVPLLTVLLFFHSPRYRAPALPVLGTLAACALAQAARDASARGARLVLAGALLAGVAALALNAATGFDSLDPLRGPHALRLGHALGAEGRHDEALAQYARAAAHGEPAGLAAQGDLLRRLGRRTQALPLLEQAAQAAPQDVFAQRSLAVALAEDGQLARARAAFEAALAAAPGDAESWSGLGNVLLGQGDAAGALLRYERALALRPAYANAWANRCAALLRLQRVDEAAESAARAAELDPGLAARLAGPLRAAGASAEALQRLEELGRVAPR